MGSFVGIRKGTMTSVIFDKLHVYSYSQCHGKYFFNYSLHKDSKHVIAIHRKFSYYSKHMLFKMCLEPIISIISQ
jgi:hypothetical protein